MIPRGKAWLPLAIMAAALALSWYVAYGHWIGYPDKIETMSRIWIVTSFCINIVITGQFNRELDKTQRKLPFLTSPELVIDPDRIRKLEKLCGTARYISKVVTFLTMVGILGGVVPVGLLNVVINYLGWDFHFDIHWWLLGLFFLQVLLVVFVSAFDWISDRIYRNMSKTYLPRVLGGPLATSLTSERENIQNVRDVHRRLEWADRVVSLIDYPICIGVVATGFIKCSLFLTNVESEKAFALGVATGAIALHIIAGNLMVMLAENYRRLEGGGQV